MAQTAVGEWLYFRGYPERALAHLSTAHALDPGAVSPLTLARCHWLAGIGRRTGLVRTRCGGRPEPVSADCHASASGRGARHCRGAGRLSHATRQRSVPAVRSRGPRREGRTVPRLRCGPGRVVRPSGARSAGANPDSEGVKFAKTSVAAVSRPAGRGGGRGPGGGSRGRPPPGPHAPVYVPARRPEGGGVREPPRTDPGIGWRALTAAPLLHFRSGATLRCIQAGLLDPDHLDDDAAMAEEAALFEPVSIHRHQRNGYTAYVVTMPPPLYSPEAHLVESFTRTASRSSTGRTARSTRYFTLERTDTADRPLLCEWFADGTRRNYGVGPEPDIGPSADAVLMRTRPGAGSQING